MQNPKSAKPSTSESATAVVTANGPAIVAMEIPPRPKPSSYPKPFATLFQGRLKRQLGDYFGLKKFGVNLTVLEPGSESSLFHKHSKQEEFIFVLEGTPTLLLINESSAPC
jgi:uncharacterized cupin superfamily protein